MVPLPSLATVSWPCRPLPRTQDPPLPPGMWGLPPQPTQVRHTSGIVVVIVVVVIIITALVAVAVVVVG